jgi:thiamine-phosphate pyrophosphorylase
MTGEPIRPPRIYAIADQEKLGGERLPGVAHALAEAGVGWIQLRMKRASGAEAYRWAESAARRLEGSRAALWIDDRADVAALLQLPLGGGGGGLQRPLGGRGGGLRVFGVHVGQDDLPPAAVRRAVGPALRIGRSTHDEGELRAAAADPDVDVVAFGPIFATATKDRPSPAVGLDQLRRAREWTGKPLVAIGGIDAANLGRVLAAGADAVAMIAALGDARSSLAEISRNARRLIAAAT